MYQFVLKRNENPTPNEGDGPDTKPTEERETADPAVPMDVGSPPHQVPLELPQIVQPQSQSPTPQLPLPQTPQPAQSQSETPSPVVETLSAEEIRRRRMERLGGGGGVPTSPTSSTLSPSSSITPTKPIAITPSQRTSTAVGISPTRSTPPSSVSPANVQMKHPAPAAGKSPAKSPTRTTGGATPMDVDHAFSSDNKKVRKHFHPSPTLLLLESQHPCSSSVFLQAVETHDRCRMGGFYLPKDLPVQRGSKVGRWHLSRKPREGVAEGKRRFVVSLPPFLHLRPYFDCYFQS
jgi:hypothetical protein